MTSAVTPRRATRLAALLVAASAAACAGSTVGAGVAPKLLRRPPFYAGAATSAPARIGHLLIVTGPTSDPREDAVAGSPAATLLARLNTHLDSLGTSVLLVPGVPAPPGAPDVSFGCDTQGGDECLAAEVNRGNLMLQVTRGSQEWAGWAAGELERAQADALLLITLELADYWPRSRGITAQKEVELGTGYVQSLPWLTAQDRPVQVLQLTGALIGRDGKAIRIGAEGLFARRTRLLAGAFGIREMVSDDDVARLTTLRREDLAGQPLVWQVALRNLVQGLAGTGPGGE